MKQRCSRSRGWVVAPMVALAMATISWAQHNRGDGHYPGMQGAPEGWYAAIETSMGNIVARLHPESAPQGVAHFAALAQGKLTWNDPVTGEEKGGRFYDGSEVYRSIAGRQFQFGDRSGQGDHAPFLYVPNETSERYTFSGGYRLGLVKVGPKISATRVMVTAASLPALTRTIPCIGSVIVGAERIFNITAVKTTGSGRPLEPVTIHAVKVFAVGKPEPLPEPVPYFPEQEPLTKIQLNDKTRR